MKRPGLRRKGRAWYYDAGGKPRRWVPLGTDEAAALRAYEDLTRKPPPGTVDAMLGDYLAHPREPLAAGTLANYRIFRRHLSGVFGHLLPTELTQADIRRYLKRCPRMSFRGEISLLSLAFEAWMDEGRLEFNPCYGVHIHRAKSKRNRVLTNAEIDAAIGELHERDAVAVELAWATGLRISDLCALRWADLVPEGAETRKTGARQAIEVTDALAPILERARALQARVASLYVLCDRGGAPHKPDVLSKRWRKACERAAVEDAHFHDLRAAGAMAQERAGANAQSFLGHRSRTTTEGYLRDKRANVVKPIRRKA